MYARENAVFLARPKICFALQMKRITLRFGALSMPAALFLNLLLVYVVYALCRLAFLVTNWDTFAPGFAQLDTWRVIKGTLFFDTSAILYTNVLYALLMLLPLHYKERAAWQLVCKWLFVLTNSLCVVVNMADAVYFQYTGRRTTWTVFGEFGHEGNILSIVGKEVLHHPVVLLIGIALIALLWLAYVHPRSLTKAPRPATPYYVTQVFMLGLFVPLCVAGMRGGFTTAVRPITLSNANQFVNRPAEAALVLNTPFSMIRTATKKAFVDPKYYTPDELNAIYSPLHRPGDALTPRHKNVVVIILESFGQEFVGALNPQLDGGRYKGVTPFLDSLIGVSTTYENSFANGRKSIDGMPSVLSSIPMFVEPFFLTPASLNHLSGLARELNGEGYHTAFFHGAQNGSMGFEAFARSTGFGQYYGRTEFDADPRFGGENEFDGTWAIWDEPFLQFYAKKMSEMKQPFMTAVFTASSHAPYKVPERYAKQFPEEGDTPLHKCVRYSDMALRKFFETARRQPWYKNTIFVLTADHTSLSTHEEYQTPLGRFRVPIIFFDPSGDMKPGRRPGIAKQIDIMPTLLGYLGFQHPFVAFGNDLTHLPATLNYEVAYLNGVYVFAQGDYVLLFDGSQTTGVFDYKKDRLMVHNLKGRVPQQAAMERLLKAIIQSYMQRMLTDQLTVK
jgi:membrane protein